MGDLSPNFSRYEFACKGKDCCGGSAPISIKLISNVELLRASVSKFLGEDTPLNPKSGFRCYTHNAELIRKGRRLSKRTSQHISGLATDIDIPTGIDEATFFRIVYELNIFYGIGRYNSFIHLDNRIRRHARWDNRTKVEPTHASQNA